MSTSKTSVPTSPPVEQPLADPNKTPVREPSAGTTPLWMRPFVFGGAAGVGLVLLVLFMIPSSPTTTTTTTTTTSIPVGTTVAQSDTIITPVIETPADEHPLPRLSPTTPPSWNLPNPVPLPAPRKATTVKEAEDPPFKSNPSYQPPSRPKDWVDEALSDSNPDSATSK